MALPSPFSAADAGIFFQDGVLATLGDNTSAKVHLNDPEEIGDFSGQSLPGAVKGLPQIEYATASLVLERGKIVTINGQKYKVRWTRKTGDGVISLAELAVFSG